MFAPHPPSEEAWFLPFAPSTALFLRLKLLHNLVKGLNISAGYRTCPGLSGMARLSPPAGAQYDRPLRSAPKEADHAAQVG